MLSTLQRHIRHNVRPKIRLHSTTSTNITPSHTPHPLASTNIPNTANSHNFTHKKPTRTINIGKKQSRYKYSKPAFLTTMTTTIATTLTTFNHTHSDIIINDHTSLNQSQTLATTSSLFNQQFGLIPSFNLENSAQQQQQQQEQEDSLFFNVYTSIQSINDTIKSFINKYIPSITTDDDSIINDLIKYLTTLTNTTTTTPTPTTIPSITTISKNPFFISIAHAETRTRKKILPHHRAGSVPSSDDRKFYYGGLQTDRWLEYPIIQHKQVTPTKHLYFFQLPDDQDSLSLPPCSFVIIRVKHPYKPDEYIHGAYFPFYDQRQGEFAILGDVDVESDNNNDALKRVWPKINIGDSIEFMGPFYTDFSYRPHTFDEIIMIAGGPVGVLPMYQVLKTIWLNENDHTRVHLIYCNKDSDRALFQYELNMPRNQRSIKQFVITNMLEKKGGGDNTKNSQSIDFAKGFIENTHYGLLTRYKLHRLIGSRKQSVEEYHEKRKILVSGPDEFVDLVCGLKARDGTQGELTGWLKELGYLDFEVTKL